MRWLVFNLWYFRNPPWDTGISPPELIQFIEANPPGRALDLGCGTGTNVITLFHNGWKVVGIDFALPAIYAARKKAREAGAEVTLRVGDAARINWINDQFDLILDMGCFHGLNAADRHLYLQHVAQWLAPDGTFLLYVFFKDPGEQNTVGITAADLDEINQHFSIVSKEYGTERGQRASAWLTIKNHPQGSQK